MTEATQILRSMMESENLLIAIPIIIILLVIITLLGSYVYSSLKKKSEQKKKKEENKDKTEKIDFRKELAKLDETKNSERSVKNLSILINKFLSKLFKIKHAFMYEEIKKEAENYGFNGLIELCDVTSKLNFSKDKHTEEDFEELKNAFEKALDSYEYVVVEEGGKAGRGRFIEKLKTRISSSKLMKIYKKIIKEKTTPTKISFKGVWDELTPVMDELEIDQLKKKLLTQHSYLFSKDVKEHDNLTPGEDQKEEMKRLLKAGETEIKKWDTVEASAAYNSAANLFNKMNPSERKQFGDEINELYLNILNVAGIKVANKMIEGISKAVETKDEGTARQLYHQLRFIYERLPPKSGEEIYKRWASISTKAQ